MKTATPRTTTVTIADVLGRDRRAVLTPRPPLDGLGGATRQGYDVATPDGRCLGRITRHRPGAGRVRWTSTSPDGFMCWHTTREAAVDFLL